MENARALDEIKRLKKEKTEITNEIKRDKISIGKKIVEFLKNRAIALFFVSNKLETE
ncbi:hypothetical protein PL321_12905 [Caloramator sp. mosi_1]|uniref:hypothetical protein n=1 Tax=Caloramator sp. mosi_1 TaxID=3023090 RepID=UPI00235FD6FA|nr:hypothetical protein [Caloramator sp. mosi_1]WDC83566.1 hypothetical protein PL321_12905 [Caloramator sp. mosi_1]